jgi:hypothetical protein
MSDPMNIKLEQLRAAYDALGLDPNRFDQTQSFLVEPGVVTVVRVRVDEAGQNIVLPGRSALATETVQVSLEEIAA